MENQAFSQVFQEFFIEYLPQEKGSSSNTITAYKYAFIAFFKFLKEKYHQSSANFCLEQFNYETINDFLLWSEEQKVSDATYNQRLTAISNFAKFLLNKHPELAAELGAELTKITNIQSKKPQIHDLSYINPDGIKAILEQVDCNSLNGVRDYLILTMMAVLGLRVSEVVSLQVKDLYYTKVPSIIVGSTSKAPRSVPINEHIINALDKYLYLAGLSCTSDGNSWLFPSNNLNQMTRQNLSYIVDKYATLARESLQKAGKDMSIIPPKVTPQILRSSAAVNLISANKYTIRAIQDILGYKSLKGLEVYIQATNGQFSGTNKDQNIEEWLREQIKLKSRQHQLPAAIRPQRPATIYQLAATYNLQAATLVASQQQELCIAFI